jgi:hypothetical protein
MADLVSRLAHRPLLLNDARSGLLVLLGVGLGLLAIIDGSLTSDMYPGFTAVGLQRQRAIQRYAEEQTKCFAGMTQLRNEAVENMSAAIELIRGFEFDLQSAVQGRARLHKAYASFLDDLADAHQRLIQGYRDANRRVRTAPPPVYFGTPIARPLFLKPPSLALLPELEQDARREVIGRIEHYIKLLNERFERTLPAYDTVRELTVLSPV